MSSGPGTKSRIYRTADGGAHWSPLYTNRDASGFFDALAFWDALRGVVLGDPVDGQFVILTTEDGGQTWQRRKLPPALPNEGAFAASNSCLLVRGEREVWFGTGGPSGAPEGPPVPNHTSRSPRTSRQELLAANAPSFGSAGGNLRRCQV